MKKKIITSAILLLPLLFVIGSITASAQETGTNSTNGERGTNPVRVTFENPFQGGPTSLFELIKTIINDILMPIGGVIAVLAFIYSGFLYVKAQGNTTQIKDAHNALLYTSVGTAILLGAWVLANVICQTISELGGPACGI